MRSGKGISRVPKATISEKPDRNPEWTRKNQSDLEIRLTQAIWVIKAGFEIWKKHVWRTKATSPEKTGQEPGVDPVKPGDLEIRVIQAIRAIQDGFEI